MAGGARQGRSTSILGGDLSRVAVRRGRLHLRRPGRASALLVAERTLCLFGHTHARGVQFDTDYHPVAPPRGETFRLLLDDAAKPWSTAGQWVNRAMVIRAQRSVCSTSSSRTLTVMRVPYDVATAQAKIIAAGLRSAGHART